MNNYTSVNSLYKLGSIKIDPQLRINQGLPTQVIANQCIVNNKQCSYSLLRPINAKDVNKGYIAPTCEFLEYITRED